MDIFKLLIAVCIALLASPIYPGEITTVSIDNAPYLLDFDTDTTALVGDNRSVIITKDLTGQLHIVIESNLGTTQIDPITPTPPTDSIPVLLEAYPSFTLPELSIESTDLGDGEGSCLGQALALTAAMIAVMVSCAGPQSATGACLAAAVAYVAAAANYEACLAKTVDGIGGQ